MSVRAFAPASVGNVICGFDVFGLALEAPGDEVVARRREEPGVGTLRISGDDGRLPPAPDRNTAGVAAAAVLEQAGAGHGVELELSKGLPLASGLGSSAASAVAAAVAVDELLGSELSPSQLLACAAEGERVACGTAHLDNAAPCLLGGFVLVHGGRPVTVPVPEPLCCGLVRPHLEVATAEARAALEEVVPLERAVRQWSHAAALVAGLYRGDWSLISSALVDEVAEPKRAPLVPGLRAMQRAAREAGALGCSLSGGGPTVVAICRGRETAEAAADAMLAALRAEGVDGDRIVSGVGSGARVLEA